MGRFTTKPSERATIKEKYMYIMTIKLLRTKYALMLPFILSYFLCFGQTPLTVTKRDTRHGPENGSLILIGGGGSTAAIWDKFTELAGGKEKAKIVVITAAAGDSLALSEAPIALVKQETGITDVVLLHTKDLKEANSEDFVKPLLEATGVYIVGGRQWRIADSYLNTRTHQAINDLLSRGGVIAGTSAGATIQGSFLWRGDTKGSEILIGDHTQGFGFLKYSVIDQHFLRRNRQFDLIDFVKISPEYIGIGLDEATAIVVQKDILEVLGKSYVAIYEYNTLLEVAASPNSATHGGKQAVHQPFFLLKEGQKYDLNTRKIITE
ncbi:cyanophycinase [Arenibacter sp. GZD96]|uniref:cyanophycinase n=1 Tax=Aurantibrevibacter litoralis TaxID=3106030 RepID=UPI002AFF2C03|nr:cyanophycinase [Arenibacter sp. GZD-96]MEA1784851.1 cyanophycinase [Arenibacter sp. GZD-96]